MLTHFSMYSNRQGGLVPPICKTTLNAHRPLKQLKLHTMSRWFNGLAGPCKADTHYMLSPTSPDLPDLERLIAHSSQPAIFE